MQLLRVLRGASGVIKGLLASILAIPGIGFIIAFLLRWKILQFLSKMGLSWATRRLLARRGAWTCIYDGNTNPKGDKFCGACGMAKP